MKQIINRIDELLNKQEQIIITIDGCAASGKSTLAKELQTVYNAEVIHMDDFFLPFNLRTKERLDEPGGNIHYERFKEEVINNLGTAFSYQVFNCHKGCIESSINVKENKVIIIEGSYALHPYFGKYYDLSIFLDIEENLQLERILKRDGSKYLEIFKSKWIVFENKYHDFYSIKKHVDIYKYIEQ